MKNLALERIQKMQSYNPPLEGRRAYDGILLDFNERTVKPSKKVIKALEKYIQSDQLQTYPEYGTLEGKIAQYAKTDISQILLTNGSDQAIDMVFRTFTDVNDTVIIPSPSFAMFSQSAQTVGNKITKIFYKASDLSFPLKQLLKKLDNSIKLIVLCNPNNPTGTILSINDIEKIAKKAPNTIIMVDEAYFEFSGITAVPLIKKNPNIVVLRTFSKAFGIPSLRLGYIIANEQYIRELQKVRGPYDINMMAYTAALAALEELKELRAYVTDVMNYAKPLVETFFKKNNIDFFSSASNFILYKPLLVNEDTILQENGIRVRPQNKEIINNTVRLTIGTTKQMKKFIKIYENSVIKKRKKEKCAFIDRDGTLIFEPQDTYQIDSISKLKILDGVIEGLKKLIKNEYKLIMVSNQDGLGTDSFPRHDFQEPQEKMLDIFKENGITFTDIFICPHFANENCLCRKPKIGLLGNNILKKIDKKNSFVCGDRKSDKKFAKNIGITYIPMQTNTNFFEAIEKGDVINK